MKQRKQYLIILCAIVFLLASYGCVYVYYHIHIKMEITTTICDLGDIREAFLMFHKEHGLWPNTIEEAYGTKLNDGIITADYKDSISGDPFRCVTKKELYYQKQDSTEKPYKVLVTLPRPYRTKLSPFGETRTIILISDGSVVEVSPLDIADHM